MSQLEIEQLVNFLKKVSFFSQVQGSSLNALCSKIETVAMKKNAIVFSKGDVDKYMYVIYEGSVEVHDEEHVFGILNKGECFGEYALIDDKERSASITTLEKSVLLKIENLEFKKLMLNDAGFSQGILAEMIKRHRELDAIQEQLALSKQELELANNKFSGLIQSAKDAIILFNCEFRILLTNPSANALLENKEVLQRNILFFLDEDASTLIEKLIGDNKGEIKNQHLPSLIKTIGSNGKETLNEGTLSSYGNEEVFYTLILRNIEDKLIAEDKISKLTSETTYLKNELDDLTNNFGIISNDETMKSVLNQIHQVASTDANVLINGETGTGKELVARAIHDSSRRNEQPMIKINCGAIPENLIESELFGHLKGAFTGASSDRKGRFLLADKGTLFLDEIGELPLALQPKLLRVIQEGEFEPLGSSKTIKVDVRIVAATHRNLQELARKGDFREDLYYRLNVFPIEVPALRDRGKDISLIAEYMLQQFFKKMGKKPIELTLSDKEFFYMYNWPGNVRELQNILERAAIVSTDSAINWSQIIPSANNSSIEELPKDDIILSQEEINSIEKENILRVLRKTNWKISGINGAASLLNIPSTTLNSKIKAFKIKRPV